MNLLIVALVVVGCATLAFLVGLLLGDEQPEDEPDDPSDWAGA